MVVDMYVDKVAGTEVDKVADMEVNMEHKQGDEQGCQHGGRQGCRHGGWHAQFFIYYQFAKDEVKQAQRAQRRPARSRGSHLNQGQKLRRDIIACIVRSLWIFFVLS